MIPKHIIEKAIEGGHINTAYDLGKPDYNEYEIICDPLFWSSLGKALGWIEYNDERRYYETTAWPGKAHEFYNVLLTNGDTEKFWADLIK